MKSFNELLEEYRKEQQISKTTLTKRTGLSSGYISLLTRGNRTAPSKETVALLADALSLTAEHRTLFFASAGYQSEGISQVATATPSLISQDWGDAPDVQFLYGRTYELTALKRWIVDDACQMVAIVGIGGIGKTMLASKLVHEVQTSFKAIFWRSLRNVPSVTSFLKECLQFLPFQKFTSFPDEIDILIMYLIAYLREHRSLIVLDNVESVLQKSNDVSYQESYEGYHRLFEKLGSIKHQSCLLLTSREKPKEIAVIEGDQLSVRSWSLYGLAPEDASHLLREKNLRGSASDQNALVRLYAGNPLALKVVAQFIREVFDGDIASFLEEGEVIFSKIGDVLAQQIDHLSPLEKDIMYWLAIEREPIAYTDLFEDFVYPPKKRALFEALDSLKRRSLIENHSTTRFTLQSVIMEYMTENFVDTISEELLQERLDLFLRYPLLKAQAQDYVRNSQRNQILKPIADRLSTTLEPDGYEKKLQRLLTLLRQDVSEQSGYAAGSILNLLVYLNIDLRRYDFSHLTVRQAYLRGVSLPELDFTSSNLATSVFTDTFGSIFSVASNRNGELLAAGTSNGEVRVWSTTSFAPLRTLQGHTEWVRTVAFNKHHDYSDLLASGSEDKTLSLWNIRTGEHLQELIGHTGTVYSAAFSPDGRFLASGSADYTMRLWNVLKGVCIHVFEGHTSRIFAVAFSPDGRFLASGGGDRTVRLWNVETGACIRVFEGHTDRVRSVAFSPDGKLLASGGGDRTVMIWDVYHYHTKAIQKLQGHTNWIWSVAFHPLGTLLASGSDDQTIRLWDTQTWMVRKMFTGSRVYSLAFSDDGNTLVSGSDGQEVKVWDVQAGSPLKTLIGHGSRIYTVAFYKGHAEELLLASGSEDGVVRVWDARKNQCIKELQGHSHWIWSVCFGTHPGLLASGSEDRTIKLWNTNSGVCIRTLYGHANRVYSVAFSSHDQFLASSSGDETIKLWDIAEGECLHTFIGHEGRVYSVAFSPNDRLLASSSEDQTIKVWNIAQKKCICTFTGHTNRVRSIRFSADETMLISSSDDHTVRLWDLQRGVCVQVLSDHKSWVWSVACSPDNRIIASAGEDQMIRLWERSTGAPLATLSSQGGTIYSLDFDPTGKTLAAGCHKGMIELWDIQSKQMLLHLRSARPYEQMNITGVRGLTSIQKDVLKALGAFNDNDSSDMSN